MSSSSEKQPPNGSFDIGKILTSLQQGVIAINSVTQTLKATFPST